MTAAKDKGERLAMLSVLALLEARPRQAFSVMDIASATGLSKQTVVRILNDLNTYFVIRCQSDPNHKQRLVYDIPARQERRR